MKGATEITGAPYALLKYFNPRSREGSDKNSYILSIVSTISIHAPVKGATLNIDMMVVNELISIHAPVKGATKITLQVRGPVL